MYLHIGNNVIIDEEKLIGIFDIDNVTESKITSDFLINCEKQDTLINIGRQYDLPKAFVIYGGKENYKTYITPITSQTLLKRSRLLYKDTERE